MKKIIRTIKWDIKDFGFTGTCGLYAGMVCRLVLTGSLLKK